MLQIYLGFCYERGGEWDVRKMSNRLPPPLTLFWGVLMPLALRQPKRHPYKGATSNLLWFTYLTYQREINLGCVRKSGAQGLLSANTATHNHLCLNLPTLQHSNLQDYQPIYTSGCGQRSLLSVHHSPFTSARRLAISSLSLSFFFWTLLKIVMKASHTNMLNCS